MYFLGAIYRTTLCSPLCISQYSSKFIFMLAVADSKIYIKNYIFILFIPLPRNSIIKCVNTENTVSLWQCSGSVKYDKSVTKSYSNGLRLRYFTSLTLVATILQRKNCQLLYSTLEQRYKQLNQCCGSGSALIWMSWIRNRVRIGNADPDPDPGAWILTKIYK